MSNAFLDPADVASERRYPLRVRLCGECALVQVDDAVPATEIFSADYAYLSSFSDSWLAQCRDFARSAVARFGLDATSRMVEIASNDGYLLQYFVQAGVPVLGIEPAANAAALATARGIPTETMFFNARTARDLAARGVAADLLYGANVLAHVPDMGDFLAGVPVLLSPRGTLVLEFPHLLTLINGLQFDTIYHEHFSYLSLMAVERALATQGLAVYDLEAMPSHGGSLRLYCARVAENRPVSDAVRATRAAERAAAIDIAATMDAFAGRIVAVREQFLAFLARARQAGQRVAAYGAAAKGNTFLNSCGITADELIGVFDRSPLKQGKVLPGSHVPVLPPESIGALRPDFVLILPWNLRAEIAGQLAGIGEWGGRLVVAVPTLDVFAP